MIITIDGPVASGKSTIARLLAQKLGFSYLNSGLFYRALAYLLVQEGYTQDTMLDITPSELKAILEQSPLVYAYTNNRETLALHDEDISPFLTSEQLDEGASRLSTVPFVRDLVDAYLRQFAADKDCVIDGRDTGSVVFPGAEYKFFLTADLDVRAERWLVKQAAQGNEYTLEQAESIITQRDERDRKRLASPLVVPEGATIVHNDGNNPDEVVLLMKQVL